MIVFGQLMFVLFIGSLLTFMYLCYAYIVVVTFRITIAIEVSRQKLFVILMFSKMFFLKCTGACILWGNNMFFFASVNFQLNIDTIYAMKYSLLVCCMD